MQNFSNKCAWIDDQLFARFYCFSKIPMSFCSSCHFRHRIASIISPFPLLFRKHHVSTLRNSVFAVGAPLVGARLVCGRDITQSGRAQDPIRAGTILAGTTRAGTTRAGTRPAPTVIAFGRRPFKACRNYSIGRHGYLARSTCLGARRLADGSALHS